LANANINLFFQNNSNQAPLFRSLIPVTVDNTGFSHGGCAGTLFYRQGKKQQKKQKTSASSSVLWKTLLNLIKNTSSKEKLNGIVLALNLPELMKKNSNQQKRCCCRFEKRITDIRAQFGSQLPFHIVITKCDLLPGFSEFFSESGGDEISQTWHYDACNSLQRKIIGCIKSSL